MSEYRPDQIKIVDFLLLAKFWACLLFFPHPLLENMHKKFEINRTKIKGVCQSGRKVVTHDSKIDLPLDPRHLF